MESDSKPQPLLLRNPTRPTNRDQGGALWEAGAWSLEDEADLVARRKTVYILALVLTSAGW